MIPLVYSIPPYKSLILGGNGSMGLLEIIFVIT